MPAIKKAPAKKTTASKTTAVVKKAAQPQYGMSQYHIWYGNSIIESTGYIESLKKAIEFVRGRYGNDTELAVQACYPVRHETRHPVNKA